MKIQYYSILLLSMFISTLHAQDDDRMFLLKEKLPAWSLTHLKNEGYLTNYDIADFINPYYIEGDFNNNSKVDIAILIEEKKTKKKGFIILHNDGDKAFIIGAGTAFGQSGDDLSYLDLWKVYHEDTCTPGIGEKKAIFLVGDGIWLAKTESSSALLYWTGKEYKWSQQSD